MFLETFLGVGTALLAYDWMKKRDARDLSAVRAAAAASPALPPSTPVTPVGPSGPSASFGPLTPIAPVPGPPAQAPAPIALHQLSGDSLSPQSGALYRVSVVVHFPLSIAVNANAVTQQAKDHGFTDATTTTVMPAGWPGASGDYYVTGHYAGGPTNLGRSYAGGQVSISDVWEGT